MCRFASGRFHASPVQASQYLGVPNVRKLSMSLAALSRETTWNQPSRSAPPAGPVDPGMSLDAEEVSETAAEAPQPSGSNAFETLTRYIPTETITLYLGAMAALKEFTTAGISVWAIYAFFAILTPILLIVLTLGHARQSGEQGYAMLHWWPPLASTIAFLVWAMSVPGHPIANQWSALPALGALFVSTFLTALDPIFGAKPVAIAT